MKKRLGSLTLGLCLFAFAGGFVAHRLAGARTRVAEGDRADSGEKAMQSARRPSGGAGSSESDPGSARRPASSLRSTDSLESLAELESHELYGRLALWMLDATAEEIAAYWKIYEQRAEQDRDITELVFIHWTRLDPYAATAAVEGTKNEEFAWWAWGCHDPAAAIAAASANKPERLGNVARGIGEFHPEWFMAHFDELPEQGRASGFGGLTKWSEGGDPLEILNFLAAHEAGGHPTGLLNKLIRDDPWAAVEWYEENGDRVGREYVSREDSLASLINGLLAAHPEVLAELVSREPPGARRRQMEQALFDELARSDLEAAIEQAGTERAPRLAAHQLGTVGLELAHRDPDRAFEMVGQLLQVMPNPFSMGTTILYPNGGTSSSGPDPKVNELVDILLAEDPERLMNAEPAGAREGTVRTEWMDNIAVRWARQDLEEFAGWVTGQSEEVRDEFAPTVIGRLSNQQRHEEAAEWTMSLAQNRKNSLRITVEGWISLDPAAAREWVQQAEITPEERAFLEPYLRESK